MDFPSADKRELQLLKTPSINKIITQKAALADWKNCHEVRMIMRAASLMWAGAAENREQPKIVLKVDKMI